MNAGEDGRARILAAAERLFLEHGFARVTMDDISSALGMSKKTLYRHFQSKEELCGAVLDALFAALDEALRMIVEAEAVPFEERLSRYMAQMTAAFEKARGPLLRDLMREAPALYQRVVDERKAIVRRRTRALFTDGVSVGALRDDVPEHFIVALIMVISEHLMHPDRLAELSMSPPEAFKQAISVLLSGMRPRHAGENVHDNIPCGR
jgi:AcrR family transcriptional regulator